MPDADIDLPRSTGALWSAWAPTLRSARSWVPSAARTVVISPHPDDESLSSGGLIARQRRLGHDVVVVAVTDGDAAYTQAGDPALAAVRRTEQNDALHRLGVEPQDIVRLGIPDGQVTEHERRIGTALDAVLEPGDTVIAPWVKDHHPDHEATGRAAVASAQRRDCSVMFSLFWTWHHSTPSALVPVDAIRRLALSVADLDLKTRAVACHVSQFENPSGSEPILDHDLAEPSRWSDEFYLHGPDSTTPTTTTQPSRDTRHEAER